jgi:hypothetical protein
MWARNSSRDAEQAQDAADVGAPSSTHHRDIQDESGHVTFRRNASAAGPNHTDPNFRQTMQQVVGGLYEQEDAAEEQIDDGRDPQSSVNDPQSSVDEESLVVEQQAIVYHRVEDLITDGQGQLGRGRGGRGRGQRRGAGRQAGHGGGRQAGHAARAGDHGRGAAPAGPGGRPVIRVELENPVTLQEMADGVVDKGVYSKYCNDIIHFASWMNENEVAWFTDYGKATYDALHLLQEDERKQDRRKRIKAGWMAMLRNARQNPIIDINNITPSRVMEGWISKQANQVTLKPLLSADYGGKLSAVFHLFRVHNGKGPTSAFPR